MANQNMVTVSAKVPRKTREKLDKTALTLGIPRSEVIEAILWESLFEGKKNPLLKVPEQKGRG